MSFLFPPKEQVPVFCLLVHYYSHCGIDEAHLYISNMPSSHIVWFSFSSIPVDINDSDMMLNIINSSITTKAISRWSSLACNIALDAVKTVQFEENGRKEIDIKKYAKVEKVNFHSVYIGSNYILA